MRSTGLVRLLRGQQTHCRGHANEPLSADEIHLWLLLDDASPDPCLLERYRGLLTEDERRREHSYRFRKDQRRYLMTRVLVRTVLSRYCQVMPHEWVFTHNAHGRPAIANDGLAAQEMSFNISHTAGLTVLGVTRRSALGVDAEYIRQRPALARLAERFFSSSEAADLRALPAEQQAQRFAAYWTLKESYIKARGKGLSIPLDVCSFSIRDTGISANVQAQVGDVAANWEFWLLQPTAAHVVAVCAQSSSGTNQRVVTTRVVGDLRV